MRILNNNSFQNVFELNQKQEDIKERNDIIGALEDELKGFQYIRIVDFKTESQKIHFSSNQNDIRSATSLRVIYDLWRNSVDFEEDFVVQATAPVIEFNEESSSIIYKIPVKDSIGLDKGIALVYFSSSGFKEYLFSKGLSSSNSLIQLIGKNGIIIDLKQEQLKIVTEKIIDIKNSNIEQPQLISSNLNEDRFFLLNKSIDNYNLISDLDLSIVIKESELQLNPILVLVLLSLVFATFFLLFFLLF